MCHAPYMTQLTSKQRAHLRSLANRLKPVIHVGTEGVSKQLLSSTSEAFNKRELIKVRAQEGTPRSIKNIANDIASRLSGVHVIQTIGHIAVLYPPHPDDPQIQLSELTQD